jgi:predicted transcriptional regulator
VLVETLEAALQLKDEWSVQDLAARLRLSPQAANNCVRLLTRSGALQRERISQPRGGREFRYRIPVAA